MANVMMTGFEFGTWPFGWSAVGGGDIGTNTPYTGNYVLRCYYGGAGGKYNFPSPLTEFYYQFRLRAPDGGRSFTIFTWGKGSNILGSIVFNANTFDVYVGATKVITGVTTINTNTYYQVELHIKIDASVGIVQLKINGLAEGSIFNGNTKPGIDTTVDNIQHLTSSWTGSPTLIDDCVLNDTTGARNNSFPDGWKMARLAPTGDDTPLQFVPYPASPTTHYDKVDEVPPSGSDYLNVTIVDQIDKFVMADAPIEALQIMCVDVKAFAIRGSMVAPTTLKLGVDIGGTNYLGSGLTLGSVTTPVVQKFETKPTDSTPWLVADVNAVKAIIETAA